MDAIQKRRHGNALDTCARNKNLNVKMWHWPACHRCRRWGRHDPDRWAWPFRNLLRRPCCRVRPAPDERDRPSGPDWSTSSPRRGAGAAERPTWVRRKRRIRKAGSPSSRRLSIRRKWPMMVTPEFDFCGSWSAVAWWSTRSWAGRWRWRRMSATPSRAYCRVRHHHSIRYLNQSNLELIQMHLKLITWN